MSRCKTNFNADDFTAHTFIEFLSNALIVTCNFKFIENITFDRNIVYNL